MGSKQKHFKYSGKLVFDQIYETDVDGSNNFDNMREYFPKFDQGKADVPGNGFHINHLSEYELHHQMSLNDFTFDETVIDYFEDKSRNIINLEYIFEHFENNVEAVVDDERRMVSVVKSNKLDFYWNFPNYLVRRGGRHGNSNTKNLFTEEFLETTNLERMRFSSDFLLWLLYQSKKDNSLKNDLFIKSISDISLTESDGSHHRSMRFSGSHDPFNSPEVMKRILSGGEIQTLGVSFIIDNRYELKVDISDVGRIHIKANSSDLSNRNDAEKIILSLRLIELVCDLYELWMNSNEEKISNKISNHLHDSIRESGVEFSQGFSRGNKEKRPDDEK